MSKDAKFLRLLSDYENLTRDETFALTEEHPDMARIAAIQGKKAIIFPELEKEAQRIGISRWKYPALTERFATLIALERANAAYVAAELERIRLAIEEVQVVSMRIQSLNRTYIGSVFDDSSSRINTKV